MDRESSALQFQQKNSPFLPWVRIQNQVWDGGCTISHSSKPLRRLLTALSPKYLQCIKTNIVDNGGSLGTLLQEFRQFLWFSFVYLNIYLLCLRKSTFHCKIKLINQKFQYLNLFYVALPSFCETLIDWHNRLHRLATMQRWLYHSLYFEWPRQDRGLRGLGLIII